MAHDKPPRHVAVALIFSFDTHRLLMITSRAYPHLWILPKGGIEEGETAGQAAVREAWEEAGSPPSLTPPSDAEEIFRKDLEPGKPGKRGSVWHAHVLSVSEGVVASNSHWPESHQRRREWVTPKECLSRIEQWYVDEAAKQQVEGGRAIEADSKGGRSKKAIKGGAMEMILRAFIEQHGWEPA